IGANPLVSNGSMMTAPDVGRRLRAIRDRGGKIIVIDPRRSETAAIADEHLPIRPGSDAALLLALVHVLLANDRIDQTRMRSETRGWDDVRVRLAAFSPQAVERVVGLPPATIE